MNMCTVSPVNVSEKVPFSVFSSSKLIFFFFFLYLNCLFEVDVIHLGYLKSLLIYLFLFLRIDAANFYNPVSGML